MYKILNHYVVQYNVVNQLYINKKLKIKKKDSTWNTNPL